MKILKQIKSTDKLPNKNKWYFVNLATKAPVLGIGTNLKFCTDDNHWYGITMGERYSIDEVEFWYEPIEEILDSETIFPVNERCNWKSEPTRESPNYLINILIWRYEQALYAAENKIAELLKSNS